MAYTAPMLASLAADLPSFIATYGYWFIGLAIGLESLGLPLPGEATLISAALYAGSTHHLSIGLIILVAALGAVLGDNIGFWIGHEVGDHLLAHHGRRIGITEGRLKLGRYMFLLHGGKMVFFGRFVTVLRALAALLAGANHMPWGRFFLFNVTGGIAWTVSYGLGAYLLGAHIEGILWSIHLAGGVAAIAGLVVMTLLLRHHHARLQEKAEAMFPGPL